MNSIPPNYNIHHAAVRHDHLPQRIRQEHAAHGKVARNHSAGESRETGAGEHRKNPGGEGICEEEHFLASGEQLSHSGGISEGLVVSSEVTK